jgi:hypothetical protein
MCSYTGSVFFSKFSDYYGVPVPFTPMPASAPTAPPAWFGLSETLIAVVAVVIIIVAVIIPVVTGIYFCCCKKQKQDLTPQINSEVWIGAPPTLNEAFIQPEQRRAADYYR